MFQLRKVRHLFPLLYRWSSGASGNKRNSLNASLNTSLQGQSTLTARVPKKKFQDVSNDVLQRMNSNFRLHNTITESLKTPTFTRRVESDRSSPPELPRVKFSFQKYRITAQEMKKPIVMPPESTTNPVTEKNPPAQCSADIKGINGVLYRMASVRRFYGYKVLESGWFGMSYYPPHSFVGALRKSKPALVFQFDTSTYLNSKQLKRGLTNLPLKHPFQFEVHRKKTRQLYRKLFWKAFSDLKGIDGVYFVRLSIAPNPRAISQVRESLTKAVQMTLDKTWSYKMNRHFEKNDVNPNWKAINRRAVAAGMPALKPPSAPKSRSSPKQGKAPHKRYPRN
ncbi:unnamed protein product [Kuraishia capsulata CBS 1993]|uniref:Uncharacterized protein n=1 Tax=Kuraishia capsulata CBS 1993 TaxID=1382522 RepID=W6MFV4_9ASCO|nr:uncharacterized protein KUCA_T00000791001 [Kuraishia capsulata CBS 1993]CDK24824.1 unnamed protein product [Kuraishia capsulata CBS 1993]